MYKYNMRHIFGMSFAKEKKTRENFPEKINN